MGKLLAAALLWFVAAVERHEGTLVEVSPWTIRVRDPVTDAVREWRCGLGVRWLLDGEETTWDAPQLPVRVVTVWRRGQGSWVLREVRAKTR